MDEMDGIYHSRSVGFLWRSDIIGRESLAKAILILDQVRYSFAGELQIFGYFVRPEEIYKNFHHTLR